MYINQKFNRQYDWFSVALSLANTIVYGYSKFKEYPEAVGGDVSVPVPVPAKVKTMMSIGSCISLLHYINKIVEGSGIIYDVLDINNRKNEIEVFGKKLNRKDLAIFQVVVIVILFILALFYILDKLFNKKEDQKMSKIYAIALNVGMAIYGGIFFIWNIVQQCQDRKWTFDFSREFLSNFLLLSRVTELDPIKKSLAKTEYGYPIWYGLLTGLQGLDCGLSIKALFTGKQYVSYLKKDDFKDVDMENDALFVYFCAKYEETDVQALRFMKDIKAKHHIYITGVGARNLAYGEEYTHCIEPTSEKAANSNNTKVFTMSHEKRNIRCIEKWYNGYGSYSKDDSSKVAKYAYDEVNKVLQKNPNIKRVVFAGHGKGAAVGLSSFAWQLTTEKSQLLANCEINFFFLDPTDGQTDDAYNMGKDWNSGDLYHRLTEKYKNQFADNKLRINEIWAYNTLDNFSVAQFFHSYNLNPAKRFLYECKNRPDDTPLLLKRFMLGYTHYGLINDDCDGSEPYNELQLTTPYKMVVDLMNKYCQSGSDFSKICEGYQDKFEDSNNNKDLNSKFLNISKSLSRDKQTYKNADDKSVKFNEFIKSYNS